MHLPYRLEDKLGSKLEQLDEQLLFLVYLRFLCICPYRLEDELGSKLEQLEEQLLFLVYLHY
jgi:hypothetical protein